MLSLRNNLPALSAHRHLEVAQRAASSAGATLSSGLRINNAADDAAGLVISEALRSQARGARVASRNLQDGVSVLQTAEGALGEATAMLQRMRDLTVQALNGGAMNNTSKLAIDREYTELTRELERLGATSSFNGKQLLDGQSLEAIPNPAAAPRTFGTYLTHTERKVKEVVVAPGANTFSIQLDGLAPLTVTVPPGTYGLQQMGALNTAINNQISASPGYAGKLDFLMTGSPDDSFNGMHSHIQVAPGQPHRDLTLQDAGNGLLEALTQEPGTVELEQQNNSTPQLRRLELEFQAGANDDEKINVDLRRLSDLVAGAVTADLWHDPHDAMRAVDSALELVSAERATLGAAQNRFESAIGLVNRQDIDLSEAESRIRDTDMAQGMTALSRAQILQQAAVAMNVQANQAPNGVLTLLKGM